MTYEPNGPGHPELKIKADALHIQRGQAIQILSKADTQGWPEACMYTVYDHIFGDFPAKNTVYTLYIYGSGQSSDTV